MILADDARLPIEGAPAGGRGGGAVPAGRGARCVPSTPIGCRPRTRGFRAVRPRRRHGHLPQHGVHVRDPAVQAAGQERRRRSAPRGVLPARHDRRSRRPSRRTQVMAGLPEKAAVFADNSPVFETLDGFKGRVLAKIRGQRLAAPLRISDRREAPRRQGGGARRAARSRTRHPPWIPSRAGAASRSARSRSCSTRRSVSSTTAR